MIPKENRIKYHWSKFSIVISVLPIMIFGVAICMMLIKLPLLGGLVVSAGIIVIMSYIVFRCPLYLIDDREKIVIKLLRKTIEIPKDRIIQIKRMDKDDLGSFYREWECGLGYTGLYRSLKLGAFHMYATELSNLYLIVTEERKYVVSCTKRLEL